MSTNYDKYDENKYFDQTTINDYESSKPNIKETKKFIGKLRKIGDTKEQYVTNLYYLDTLEYSYDDTKVYSIYNDLRIYPKRHMNNGNLIGNNLGSCILKK